MEKEICPNCRSKNVIKEKIELDNVENSSVNSYLCLKCGYTTNDTFVTQEMIKNINSVSQLILDLSLYDEERSLHWFPIILISSNGSIYPEGTPENWKWSYTPIIPISEEEKEEYGEEYETRFAAELSEKFEKYNFLNACQKMGAVSPDLLIE